MKKPWVRCVLAILVILIVYFVGYHYVTRIADQEPEKILEKTTFWEEQLKNDVGGYILNPVQSSREDEIYEGVIDHLKLDDLEEKLVFIAGVDGVDFQVWEVEYSEEVLMEKSLVYEKKNMTKNTGVEVNAYRTEGCPIYKIKALKKEGDIYKGCEYYISYNGLNGNPEVEYMILKEIEFYD